MSSYIERIKLEAMYHHQRDDKHRQFLERNPMYSWFRTINTFKGSDQKTIDDSRGFRGPEEGLQGKTRARSMPV